MDPISLGWLDPLPRSDAHGAKGSKPQGGWGGNKCPYVPSPSPSFVPPRPTSRTPSSQRSGRSNLVVLVAEMPRSVDAGMLLRLPTSSRQCSHCHGNCLGTSSSAEETVPATLRLAGA